MNDQQLWARFKEYFYTDNKSGFSLDVSRVNFPDGFLSQMGAATQKAFQAMSDLERGAIANPDEQRMVGHYWLRAPELAPKSELRSAIEQALTSLKDFAAKVHSGKIAPQKGGKFEHVLVIGIGGSALGPQFVTKALSTGKDPLSAYFFDNTDPDGMAHALSTIPSLARTLCVVISKSGGTPETRNGMLVAERAFKEAGLDFAKHVVAITSSGSNLDKVAEKGSWLARFPMWDWVGGRTSELSAVGLVPAALQGFDVDGMLAGAREMDTLTRVQDVRRNPAMMMALMWHHLGGGKGTKDMVVLPYSDRLELFSRYLQQLVMESLGKEKDLSGAVVHQGIAVYGNKGSTDQHAYVQQLRDGLANFFAVFIKVHNDRSTVTRNVAGDIHQLEVEPGATCGDFLSGFFQGTRRALYENGRQSITLFVREVNAQTVGMLIALFERAVGFYATLVNVNAYHQPGVEAGKKAAAAVLELQRQVLGELQTKKKPLTADEVAIGLGQAGAAESIFLTLQHLAANGRITATPGSTTFDDRYSAR